MISQFYVKIKYKIKALLYDGNLHNINELRGRFFYKMLNKKCDNNNMESIFSREFAIERRKCTWNKIYTQKIKNIKIIKLKEFNFKLLHNIVPCGKILSNRNQLSMNIVKYAKKLKLLSICFMIE